MSNYSRPSQNSRGRGGHWPPSQRSQGVHYGSIGCNYVHEDSWTSTLNYTSFGPANWHSDYAGSQLQQQSSWHRHYPAKTQQSSWHQPQRVNSYPRGGTYNKKHITTTPDTLPPSKKTKVEIEEEENPRNQFSETNHTDNGSTSQVQFRKLLQHVQIKEPYWLSNHKIEDVLRVTDSNKKQNITCRRFSNEPIKLEIDTTVDNSSAELGQNSNQVVCIDLTNDDDTPRQHDTSARSNTHNKENTNVNNIVPEPSNTQQVSKNIASTVNTANSTVAKIALRKSNGSNNYRSVQRSTLSYRDSSDATESSRTDVMLNSNIIEKNNLEYSDSNQVVSFVSSNSTSKIKNSASNESTQNQLSKQHEILHRKNLPNNLITASLLDGLERDFFMSHDSSANNIVLSFSESISGLPNYIPEKPLCTKSHSYIQKKLQDNVPAQQSNENVTTNIDINSNIDLSRDDSNRSPSYASTSENSISGYLDDENIKGVFSEDSSDEFISSCAAAAATNAGVDSIPEGLDDESDVGESEESKSSEDGSNRCIPPFTTTVAISRDAYLVSRGSYDESNSDKSEKSNSSEDDFISVSNKVLSLSCKRKDQDGGWFKPNSKKPRTIVQNRKDDDDVIVISDDEGEQRAVNKLSPTLHNSSTSSVKSKIKNNADNLSKTTKSHMNTLNHHKLLSVESTKTVKDKKTVVKKPVTSKSEEKTKHVTSFSVKKREPQKVNKSSTSDLPSQQGGKQRHIINSRKLIVLLKRLSPHEISKFSVPKSIVDKSTVLYQKDLLYQIKYFISFIEYLSTNNSKVSLTTYVNNPKDLCNTQLYYSNKLECALVKIKYLQNSEHSKITYKTLSNPEFDIKKLYKSFLDFRKKNKKLNKFMILTNFELNMENLKSNGVKVKYENDQYQLSVNEGHELHQKFVKCLTLHNLATLLVDCMKQHKQKNFNTELIKKYHLALMKENVFVIHTKKGLNGRQIQFAKFHPNFIRNTALSDSAKELRRHITDIHSEPQPSMYFNLTDPFGRDTNLNSNPIIDFIEIAHVLASKDQTKLSILKNELKKIVGHVLEKIHNNVFGFSKQFCEGTDLPGNLKQLRRQVNTWCDHRNIDFKKFCRDYIISIDDFCNEYPVHRLPNENGNELFKEFFNIFSFASIQKHIRLNKDISKINDEACLNAVQKELFTELKLENLNRETFASIKTVISKSKIIKTSYKPLQSKIKIEFNKNVVRMFQTKLPKHGIVLCTTKCLSLTNAIVKQLSIKLNYTENKEILFITNKVLLEMTHDVLNALADKSTHLLVVQWNEPMEKNAKVLNVFDKLTNTIRLFMKLVIVIINQSNYSSEMDTILSSKITDDEHLFELSEDSRVKLMQAENISLQHRRLSLMKSDLILDEHVPILLESTEILSQLLAGKLIIGKDIVKPDGYKESLFKTQVKQCIIINPGIFYQKIEDVFVIRNIDRKELEQYLPPRQKILSLNDVPANMRINAKFILLGFNISSSFFDGYAEKNQEQSVHLLRYESGNFVWEKTSGNIKDLLRNRLGNIGDLLNTQKIENVVTEGPKTIIICGESGAGKSVCLYKFARETKNLYKTESIDAYWSLQVKLDKTRLSKYVKKDLNIALEKEFVAKFLCKYLELDEVQSKLLTMIFRNQLKIKLALFFDNYEELLPSQREFVIKLLQELQVSYCEKIYVTSTPNTRSQLENALAVFAYTLEFSEVEKVQFLQSFWSKSFGDIELINQAGNFIDNYSMSETSDDDLTITPLHLKMLAGMFLPNNEEYTPVEAHVELYKLYIEHKGLKDDESASLYSLRKILDENQLKALNLHHKYPKKGFVLPDYLRHRTFYEYFSAKWLGTRNCSITNPNFVCLLDSVSPLFLKTYLAELKTSDDMIKIVGDFAANGHLNHLKMMLTHCKGKLLLSTIIRSNSENARQSIRFLLDYYNDTKDEIMLHGEFKKKKYAESNVVKYVNRREKPKKETPLEVAARMKNITIACELLLKGADVERIDKGFVFDVARFIANEMCKTDSAWLHPIAEKLLKLQPNAVAHLDKMRKYPRLLSYFYAHGRVELINLLLKNDCKRYDILVAKVDNKSPLDIVNESRALSDDERLEITKYIVSNVGEDLERRNKYYLADVLKAAAECNHERTFEYFIGKYPEKHMGFLQNAMKSNRLDLVRFLMRKTDRMMYSDKNTALHKAVSLGVSLTTIKFLVNRGGIDNKNKFGETALCIAFKEGQDFELIEYLIKRDAHLFTKDELGLYPWCHAILEDSKYTSDEQMNIIRYLQDKIKLKAPETEQKINFESDQKRKEVARKLKFFQKPQDLISIKLELYIALKSNDESWIKFLILRGADVNHEFDGRMPLHIAIEFKRYKLAKMLLDHGAMFNAEDKLKATPLQLLMANGDESKENTEIKELLKTAEELFKNNEKYSSKVSRHLINCRDKQEQTLLHVAAKKGDKTAIKDIIRHSKNYCIEYKDFPLVDVNAKDAKGQTPLYLVKKDNVNVAKELLINGAIFEPTTTPLLQSAEKLIQAVKDKDVKKVKELVKNECLVNARDESGKSCLHYAAIFDCTEIMEIVLAVAATDVDAMDLRLQTPLHYAVEKDNIACVVLLLKAGASYDVKNKQGNRPFDAADNTNESLKLLRKIHEMFVDIKSDEPRILDNENPDALVEYLSKIDRVWHVSKDIVVNVSDSKKTTLLHIAARYDFTSVVENLLRQGSIYNPKNRQKRSPESMAISTKHLFRNISQAFDKLSVNSWVNLDPELVVNLRSINGFTLLHRCVDLGKKEEIRWLVENGADIKATSCRGFKITCNKTKYPEIFELLFEHY